MKTFDYALLESMYASACKERDALRTELDALKAGVPDGWQLVPKEPTDKMIRAATAEYVQACSRRTHPNIAWKKSFISMLAAASKPGDRND